jgi:hypothetical protein
MAKILGVIPCEGCDGETAVKKRANSKTVLYLHCKSCGMDSRNTPRLREKWLAAIEAGKATPEKVKEPVKEALSSVIDDEEWEPENKQKQSNNETPVEAINWAAWGFGALAVVGCVFGIKLAN